ncbi:MAG: V-type ATP synthase subunit K [Peptoniphilaceae bacterium]|nr:V-type ATP synthase subunit K [Peptoniphilaceae bacterium]MDD7543954.1 V-type ATP synthase subunit K [Peptoniphilaceae bacterium]MDY3075282.1 V-type ATP synthase subunit K [Peptoniphilaceae bacterium]MDY5766528.1 V-type ATP synthase subunit K [Peptoniphilaceae bacterium]
MFEFFQQYGGVICAVIGAAIAVTFAGMGSAKGVGYVGQATSALIIDEPEKFGKSLILQLLPGTQGLYGFIIAIIVMTKLSANMELVMGLRILFSCIPVGIVGYFSAIHQSRVSYAGVEILAKNEDQTMKGVIYAVMVETYAILAFITSLIFVILA